MASEGILTTINYYPAECFALNLQFVLFVDTKTAQVLKTFDVKVITQWWLIYYVI